MVAFIPLPPDVMGVTVDLEDGSALQSMTDAEIAETSSLHTKMMQLAEVYLAYSVANGADRPNFILIDNSLGGILANSSFKPKEGGLAQGDFDGRSLDLTDMQVALAHPFNKALSIPSTKDFQPHFRLIAEAAWKESGTIKKTDCPAFPSKYFSDAATKLQSWNAGKYSPGDGSFTFNKDPRASWNDCLAVFESICFKLFKDKDPKGISYKRKGSSGRNYLSASDIKFLVGVGFRALIETCWQKNILLVGIVKDSMSRFFYRNFLGTICIQEKRDINRHLSLSLTDRSIIELIPHIDTEIKHPWSSVEFDSCFMSVHPEYVDNEWKTKGLDVTGVGETSRPERLFLRSISQFFLSEDKNMGSHAVFVDRLVYPGWDDKDTLSLTVKTPGLGEMTSLYFNKDKLPRLQELTTYLLTVLVRNHYPEVLGYPEPLHQADWGAKSMKRKVMGLLESSEWHFRANPLTKTFRQIRESFPR